jgi:hypothetical protein
MGPYERIAFVYFAALAVAALVPRNGRAGWSVAAGAAAMSVLVATVAHLPVWLRTWIPHVYLVAAYWLPALLAPVHTHPTRFECWLRQTDERLSPGGQVLPKAMVHAVELAYLFCYPLVPASLMVIATLGTPADVTRFWLAVLAAGFACYASLPWLVSRPPRLAAGDDTSVPEGVAAINSHVLGRVSHKLNTFPSGHVAVSLAAAACVVPVSGLAGALIGAIAIAVAVGAVTGRYHYTVDVLLGGVVSAAAIAIAFAIT